MQIAMNSDKSAIEEKMETAPESVHSQYDELCDRLSVPKDIAKVGWEEYSALYVKHEEFHADISTWMACILYALATKERITAEKRTHLTLTHILCTGGISIRLFLKKMRVLNEVLNMSPGTAREICYIQKSYVASIYNFFKYEKMCLEIFKLQKDCCDSEEDEEKLEDLKKTGWGMFVVTKHRCTYPKDEMISMFHWLLCCLTRLIQYTPSFLLHDPYGPLLADNLSQSSDQLLEELCHQYGCSQTVPEVMAMYKGEWCRVTKEMDIFDAGLPRVSELRAANQAQSPELDELLFLDHNKLLMPETPRPRPSSQDSSLITKVARQVNRSQPGVLARWRSVLESQGWSRSRSQGGSQGSQDEFTPPPTPISAALSNVQYLQELCQTRENTGLLPLDHFLEKCQLDRGQVIDRRLEKTEPTHGPSANGN